MRRTLFIFLLTITHVTLKSVLAVNPKKGFSLKMIHRDSKESPLYPGDHLTREERLQRLIQQSKAQARYIQSKILLHTNKSRSVNPDAARLPAVYEPGMAYVASVGLGTFPDRQPPFMNYYLVIDSGSDQTWIQCEGADEYFHQDMPLYPWHKSTTLRGVPCSTHPFCAEDNECNSDGECTYESGYQGGSVTSGFLAEEKFTLDSDTGGLESIDLHMGCGLHQEKFEDVFGENHKRGKPDIIAGILGLGAGPWSFLNQLGDDGEGKFSYCFETFKENIEASNTYLRFGADATIGGQGQEVHTTPIVTSESRSSIYYINLEDISVGNKRVEFPRGTFELKEGKGGSVIDSGTPISHMYKDPFDRVAELVREHFNKLGIEFVGSRQDYDVCFRLRGRFDIRNYPSITLHFQQADYVIPDSKANFVKVSADIVCFNIFREDTDDPAFILGTMQQTNKRILYNVMEQSLSFATENCYWGS